MTRIPVVLDRAEVSWVLAQLPGVYHLAGLLLYGSGLRLLECLTLRIEDVDLGRSEIRARHEADLAAGAGAVVLLEALARKYPGAIHSWVWQWVLPATRQYADRATGEVRRHHLDPSAVQRAMPLAVRRSGIAKRAGCRPLRRSFATHLLEAGYDIPAVQEVLGHRPTYCRRGLAEFAARRTYCRTGAEVLAGIPVYSAVEMHRRCSRAIELQVGQSGCGSAVLDFGGPGRPPTHCCIGGQVLDLRGPQCWTARELLCGPDSGHVRSSYRRLATKARTVMM